MPRHKVQFRSQMYGAVFGAVSLNVVSFVFSKYLSIFKGFSIQELIGVFVCGLVGTLVIRFSYELCLIHNRIHNAYHVEGGSTDGGEPSSFIVNFYKFLGYILILLQIVCLFIKK